MYRSLTATILLIISFCVGCSSSTAPTDEIASPVVDVVTTDDAEPAEDIVQQEAAAPEELAGQEQVDPDAPSEGTVEFYMAEIQKRFEEAQVGNRLSPEGLDKAIAVSAESLERFPEDENLIRTRAVLLFQSLQAEREPQKLIDRRLELGQISRSLVERNKDNLEALGNLPGILLYEESKAYIAKGEIDQAWSSIQEAYTKGFDQPNVLYMDETFEPVTSNETYAEEIKGWIKKSIAAQMDSFESFPFAFSLKSFNTEDDTEVTLAQFKGKPVIVDFWGTWCPPCRAALPHLVDIHNEHKGELVVLGVNFEEQRGASTYEEAKEIFDEFVAKEPLPYTCLYGTRNLLESVPGFQGFPTMVFVDKAGDVRLSLTGYNPSAVLEAVAEVLLNE